jgi:hypothetical protein
LKKKTSKYDKSNKTVSLDNYQNISVDVSGHLHIAQVHSRLHQLSCEQCQFQCNHSTVYIVYALPEYTKTFF